MRRKNTDEKRAVTVNKREFLNLDIKAMQRPGNPDLKVKGYTLTDHARLRLDTRKIPRTDLLRAMNKVEGTGPYSKANDSYEKYGKRVTFCVAAGTKRIKTMYKTDPYDARKYHFKWEPMSTYNKNDPKVQKNIKIATPEKTTEKPTYKRADTNKALKTRRQARR